MMDISKDRIGNYEFRAYEMKKLVRFLSNKVRSQKFTNQFLAYNADMTETEMLECMKLKPIKHETYVKFFNSIVNIIANHREMSKENIESELMDDMKRDPLVEPNRISQIVGWNDYSKAYKSTPILPKPVVVKDKRTKDQILDDVTNDMLELVGVTDPSESDVLIAKNVVYKATKNIKNPVVSYYKCLSIRDIICELGATNITITLNSYLEDLQQKTKENVRYYFYPYSIPKLIVDKEFLTAIIDTYVEFMKNNYNMSKKDSLQRLADRENDNKAVYQNDAIIKFRSKLISRTNQKRFISSISDEERRGVFDIESVKPIRKDKFVGELLNTIGPYHKRKDKHKLNLEGSIFNINAWTTGVAINNIYKKLGVDNTRAFGLSAQKWEESLNNTAVKYVKRDLNRTTDATLLYCVEKACLCISETLHIDDIDLCRGIIINEIKKEVALLKEDLDNRLNRDQLKDFNKVIKHLFNLERVYKARTTLRHTVILSTLLKSFLPLVYNITPHRLCEADAESRYTSDIGNVKFNPITSLSTYNPFSFKKYSYSIFDAFGKQLSNVLDGRNVNYKVIADELRAFVVYQVKNHYDYYGIKPMNSDDKKNDVVKSAELDVLNFNTVEEAEDYIESLFDSNKTEEIVQTVEEDNTNIEKEENNAMSKKLKGYYIIEEDDTKDMMRNDFEKIQAMIGGLDKPIPSDSGIITEPINICNDSATEDNIKSPRISFKDLYNSMKVVEDYMKYCSDDEKDKIIDLVKSFK